MATMSISQMNTITNPTASDLVEVAQPDSGSASGYRSGKMSLSQIANLAATGTQYSGLQTTDQSLVGAINEVFQSVSDGKDLIADAITDKGIPTSATDTFQTMADNIASISGGVKITPIRPLINDSASDATLSQTLTDGIYLLIATRANSQTASFSFTGTGAYTELYNRDDWYLWTKIVKVEGTITVDITLGYDTVYSNAHKLAFIAQIEGATTFTEFYHNNVADSGLSYDFSNLTSGKTYLCIMGATSIYSGANYAYVNYPYQPDSGRFAELGNNRIDYNNDYGYRAIKILTREAPSQTWLNAKMYAYGMYGGGGVIQIIEIS